MNYSKKFRNIISNKANVLKLMNGSGYTGLNFEAWEKSRSFIGQAIHKDGKLFDIGCANGFLLLCLQEWSGHKLEPFGIDHKKELIEGAKTILHSHKENFIKKNIFEISKLPPHFPGKFDLIFWSVWREWEFELPEERKALNEILQLVAPGGRLIMGFYDDQGLSIKQITRIKELGLRFAGTLNNPLGSEMLAWVSVPERSYCLTNEIVNVS